MATQETNNLSFLDFLDYSETLTINTPLKGEISLNLWDCQIKVAKKLFKNNYLVSLSSRRTGMTILMLSMMSWYANTFPNALVFYTSNSGSNLCCCRDIFTTLLSDNINYTTTDSVELNNGSEVVFRSGRKYNLCSTRVYDMLFIDNAAYTDGTGGWWSNIRNLVKKNGYVWINSTPTDKNSWFYQVWTNTNSNNKMKIPWNSIDNRNKKWYNSIKLSLSKKNFDREILLKFL